MERFVLAMDQIAFGHGAFLFLHGAISHRPWNTRRFNRLDSQSDRLVFQIDRRVLSPKRLYQHLLPWHVAYAAKGRGRIALTLHVPAVPFAEIGNTLTAVAMI